MANHRYANRHYMSHLKPCDKKIMETVGCFDELKMLHERTRLSELRQRILIEQLNKKDGDYPI